VGKKLKLREARRRHAEHAVRAVLEAHSKHNVRPHAVQQWGDFGPHACAEVDRLRAWVIRDPETWRCRIKSRSNDKRFIDLVRFAFAKYPVPSHLENVWVEPFDDDFVDRLPPRGAARGDAGSRPDLRRWHVIVAQGGSLYRQAAHPWLSKLETHHFLNPPPGAASLRQAFWYAYARGQTDDARVARDVAMTKLDQFSVAASFWKDVARFLARNPAMVATMNDLIDYLHVAKQTDERFSLKGRTLPALLRRMEEWHRELHKHQVIGGGVWSGRAIPDIDYKAGGEHRKAIWRFRQILTGNGLFREGQQMRHCVAGYKHLCMSGAVSIWSLTSEFPIGCVNRGVTIEVRQDGTIAQCRGFANRLPYGNEVVMVKRWAREFGLNWAALER
jgi:hypothetical protein